jgi:hypothetical protein
MQEAFNLVAELGVIRAEFETDAQLLAAALSSRKADFSREATIIEDLKFQSRMWFSSCNIRFSKRHTNKIAHALAQFGAQCVANSTISWEYEVPLCVSNAVMGDCPGCFVIKIAMCFLKKQKKNEKHTSTKVAYACSHTKNTTHTYSTKRPFCEIVIGELFYAQWVISYISIMHVVLVYDTISVVSSGIIE